MFISKKSDYRRVYEVSLNFATVGFIATTLVTANPAVLSCFACVLIADTLLYPLVIAQEKGNLKSLEGNIVRRAVSNNFYYAAASIALQLPSNLLVMVFAAFLGRLVEAWSYPDSGSNKEMEPGLIANKVVDRESGMGCKF